MSAYTSIARSAFNRATGRPLSATLPGSARRASMEIRGDQLEAYDESGARLAGGNLIGTVIRFQQDPSAARPGAQFELRVACDNDIDVRFRAGPPRSSRSTIFRPDGFRPLIPTIQIQTRTGSRSATRCP